MLSSYKQRSFLYPILVGQQDAMAVAESSGIEFIGMPFTMFIAKDGEYVGAYIGELHQSHLDDAVTILTRLEKRRDQHRGSPRRLRSPVGARLAGDTLCGPVGRRDASRARRAREVEIVSSR